MKGMRDWIVPVVSFCVFFIAITIIVLFAYGKITPPNKPHRTHEIQHDVTNIKDFQKALNSSLK